MCNLLLAILFSFSANIDNIPIAMSYGIKKIHIPYLKLIIISIFTTIFTSISMVLGRYITIFLNQKIAIYIGSGVLIILGMYSFFKEILKKLTHKRCCKIDINEQITNLDTLSIILVLSTNNIAAGIAASATGLNILITTIFSFIFSYLFLYFGNIIGKNLINDIIEKYCNYISSIILIIIGIIQFWII